MRLIEPYVCYLFFATAFCFIILLFMHDLVQNVKTVLFFLSCL